MQRFSILQRVQRRFPIRLRIATLFLSLLIILSVLSCSPEKEAAIAERGDLVTVQYVASYADGSLFDASADYDIPVRFVIGRGEVLPGLEKAAVGMKEGGQKKVLLPPEDAYGLYDESKLRKVPLEAFPSGTRLRSGYVYPVRQPDGTVIEPVVVKVEADGVILDFNHVLAGQPLWIDIALVKIVKGT